MKPPYLIQTFPDSLGRAWGVVPLDGGTYALEFFAVDDGAVFRRLDYDLLVPALQQFTARAAYDKLAIDWESYRFLAGEQVTVVRDAAGMAGSEALTFDTAAEFDAYRRALLEDEYADDLDYDEGATTVADLLAAGDLEAAWRLATHDEDGSRQAWDTDFGSFRVDRRLRTVVFTDLPDWIQTAARALIA